MSKLRQKQRAAGRTPKPSPNDWMDWLEANAHLRKRIQAAIPANYILSLSVIVQEDPRATETEKAFATAVQQVAQRGRPGHQGGGMAVEQGEEFFLARHQGLEKAQHGIPSGEAV